jgi:hypothetical protein
MRVRGGGVERWRGFGCVLLKVLIGDVDLLFHGIDDDDNFPGVKTKKELLR